MIGIFIDDNTKQQCVLKLTAYSAFPVEFTENGEKKWTMVLDGGANSYTQNGYTAHSHNTLPDSFNAAKSVSVDTFKIGCAVNASQRK